MILACLGHDYAYEMENIARIFFPHADIITVKNNNFTIENAIVTKAHDGSVMVRVCMPGFDRALSEPGDGRDEHRLAVLLYTLLCEYTGRRPAWGILTGVRPVRICHRLVTEAGNTPGESAAILERDYLVSPGKARLAAETLRNELPVLSRALPGYFSLYVSVPFCPTRCRYCSFVSHAVEKSGRLIPEYVRLMCDELREIAVLTKQAGWLPQTVYIGGGTPTALSEQQLADVLSTIRREFNLRNLVEFTVEAGRPETITPEKLRIMRDHGVNRISVNPQTMSDDVLRAIGRAHTVKDVLNAYVMARESGFDSINMDLIAGLPADTAEGFAQSVRAVLDLRPENITIHTLAIKRSSHLRGEAGDTGQKQPPPGVASMLDKAYELLNTDGYSPYYLYRQKATVENLENVGFSLPGREGVYNVFSMEESQTVLAAGAGGMTKLVDGSRIRRIPNYKYPYEYIDGFAEILKRKREAIL